MLFDTFAIEDGYPALETKSADQPPAVSKIHQTARRYRPRITTSDRLRNAVLALSQGCADLLSHDEKPWSSITFSGAKHELMLDFNGADQVAAGETFIAALPEHEFSIPGQLVADATISEVEHRFGSEERMVVKAVLLLLEDR